MDRIMNTRDTETIYEIYRACRLCGAGAGYKMPIIQNVVDLDDSSEVELKLKIRECVQIEVHQEDKMPPLICELCVDKVNDFYEFLEMCRQTNKRTRLKLGLPPQSLPTGAPDAGDCILGVTEPVYVNDSDGETYKQKKKESKVKVKKEVESPVDKKMTVKLREQESSHKDSQSSRGKSKRSATPPRATRHSRSSGDDNVSLNKLQQESSHKDSPSSRGKSKRSATPPRATRLSRSSGEDNVSLHKLQEQKLSRTQSAPKSILKKEIKSLLIDDVSLLIPRLKRTRDKEPVKSETPVKKVKIALKPSSPPKSSQKPSLRVQKPVKSVKPKRTPSPPPTRHTCNICNQVVGSPQGLSNHLKKHTVNFTNVKLACDPCGEWFQSPEETSSHHRWHKNKGTPYTCRRCTSSYKSLSAFDEHFKSNQCIPWDLIPDEKCEICWHLFPTHKLFMDHNCLGEDHRPGGKCVKCRKNYALLKNLKKHELVCGSKKKGNIIVDPEVQASLKTLQVRVSRCDPLLDNIKQEHYDISRVTPDFGLDKQCVYPYFSISGLRIKSDPDCLNGMVAIKDDVRDEICSSEHYVHWDSENSDSDEELTLLPSPKKKKLDSLAVISLKTLFSQKCLGRVPRKRRRIKIEKDGDVFDSIVNQDDISLSIDNIIDNLGEDDLHSKNDDRIVNKDTISFDCKINDFDSMKEDVAAEKQNNFDTLISETNNCNDDLELSNKTDGDIHENSSNGVSNKNYNGVVGNETFDSLTEEISINSKDVSVNDKNINDIENDRDILNYDAKSQDGISVGALSDSILDSNTYNDNDKPIENDDFENKPNINNDKSSNSVADETESLDNGIDESNENKYKSELNNENDDDNILEALDAEIGEGSVLDKDGSNINEFDGISFEKDVK